MRKVNLQVPSTDVNSFSYLYTMPKINFGLSSPIGKDRTIKLCTTGISYSDLVRLGEHKAVALNVAGNSTCGPILLTTCREMITSFIRKANADIYVNKTRLDKLRLTIFNTYYETANCSDIVSVVKALNVIEKAKGWKLTCPHEINVDLKNYHHGITTDSHLLIAPKQWIASPYMLSLYLLLIRVLLVSFKYGALKPGFKDIDDISNRIKKSRIKTNYYELDSDINFLFRDNIWDWRVLINHFEEIHKGRAKQYWLTGINNTIGYYRTISNLYVDGLDKLLKGIAFNKTIGDRFEKIAKKI